MVPLRHLSFPGYFGVVQEDKGAYLEILQVQQEQEVAGVTNVTLLSHRQERHGAFRVGQDRVARTNATEPVPLISGEPLSLHFLL